MAMGTDRILHPLQFQDPAIPGRLRERLAEAGFDEAGVVQVVPAEYLGQPATAATLPLLLRRLPPDRPLHVLVRLLLVGTAEEEERVREVLGGPLTEALIEGGMLERDSEGLSSAFRVLPYQDIFVVYDPSSLRWKEAGRHAVMGVGTSSVGLANATPRRRAGRALDVGCGSGFQALQLAAFCDEVTGIDINPRALEVGRFAAELSGIGNVTFRETDYFSAVEGETFDLIVANPPFVISPESSFQYRDGGMGGDKVTETVLRGAGAHLAEGGLSLTVCEWAHYRDVPPMERVRRWVEGNGCDVWISAGPPAGVGEYATNWLRAYAGHHSAEEYARIFEGWMGYYERSGIEGVQMGLVVMRRREGLNWFQVEDAPEKIRGYWGDRLPRMLETRHRLETWPREKWLAERLTLAPEACLREELVQRKGRWALREALLMIDEPLRFSGRVDQFMAGLCARCDGTHTLRELMEGMAEALHASDEEVLEKGFPLIEELIARGFLLAEER